MSAIEGPMQSTGTDYPGHFDIVAEFDGRVGTVRPRGEIDLATAPVVDQQAQALWAEGAEQLVLDLSAVTFFDSSGLRLLIRLQTAAHEHPRRALLIERCSPPVRRVLELTRLDSRFTFADVG
jgi:anti-anti-sigma factor